MMNEYLKIFKALSDKTRLRIVKMLEVKPMCVCEIREIIGSSMSTISNHLKIITDAGIITFNKEDRYITYELSTKNVTVQKVLNLLNELSDEEIISDKQKAIITDRKNIC
jgi:ArsR family transcriptional regulator